MNIFAEREQKRDGDARRGRNDQAPREFGCELEGASGPPFVFLDSCRHSASSFEANPAYVVSVICSLP